VLGQFTHTGIGLKHFMQSSIWPLCLLPQNASTADTKQVGGSSWTRSLPGSPMQAADSPAGL
jgi:hypothetical protein